MHVRAHTDTHTHTHDNDNDDNPSAFWLLSKGSVRSTYTLTVQQFCFKQFQVAGWPQTHYAAQDDLELPIILVILPPSGLALSVVHRAQLSHTH